MRRSSHPSLLLRLFWLAPLGIAGCATPLPPMPPLQPPPAPLPNIEAAFAPEAHAQALVLRLIATARQSIRLAGSSFSSPDIVRALVAARRSGVDVRVLLDDKSNREPVALAAMDAMTRADIPVKVVAAYPVQHDSFIVVDGRHTQTGSFEYTPSAAQSNSENVLVVWNNPVVAASYLAHWESRWRQGVTVETN